MLIQIPILNGDNMMTDPVLNVKNVKKEFYEGQSTINVLENVNFKLYPNEMVVIMGASGSGKTTLLNIISGLEPPTEGEVFINDIDITKISDQVASKLRRDHIGMVFQDFNLLPYITAEENVEIPLIFTNISLKQRKSLVLEAMKLVDMIEKLRSYPNELSGGEKQRVAIARAIVNKPDIILLDEPTGNLDSQTGKEIISLFKRMSESKQNHSILMVTHDPEAAKTADKIMLLQNGIVKGMVKNNL